MPQTENTLRPNALQKITPRHFTLDFGTGSPLPSKQALLHPLFWHDAGVEYADIITAKCRDGEVTVQIGCPHEDGGHYVSEFGSHVREARRA